MTEEDFAAHILLLVAGMLIAWCLFVVSLMAWG